jgi:hypothetical protein
VSYDVCGLNKCSLARFIFRVISLPSVFTKVSIAESGSVQCITHLLTTRMHHAHEFENLNFSFDPEVQWLQSEVIMHCHDTIDRGT